jgi:hypothetical protein
MIAESYLSYPKTAGVYGNDSGELLKYRKTAGVCGDGSGELLKLPENGWTMRG